MVLAEVQKDMNERVNALMQMEIPTLQERNAEAHVRDGDSTSSVGDATPTDAESTNSDDNEWEITGRKLLFKGHKKLTDAVKRPADSLVDNDDKKPAAAAAAKKPASLITAAGPHFEKMVHDIKAHAQQEQEDDDSDEEEFVSLYQDGPAFDKDI